jgi:hypothetical protein
MKKNVIRGYIILAVLFIVLTVIAFAAPFAKTGVFWTAYLFAVVAIVYQIYIFKVAFSGEGDVKSKFYGIPIANVGIVYLIAQLTVSLLEMILALWMPFWVALILDVVITAIAIVGCIAADVMRDEIVRQDESLKKNVANMRSLQSMTASLAGQITNPDIKKVVQNLAEEFKYSDPVSSEQTLEIEAELCEQALELQKALIDGDDQSGKELANKMLANLKERNRLCGLSK